jgi:hypothetical protein
VTSAADRVHFVKDALKDGVAHPGCPSRAPACAERAYLVPGDRVIISARRDAFICATYINAEGGDRSGWLPADAVADDKAEPVAVADWLGEWSRGDETSIMVKASKAGVLRIEGVVGGIGPAASIKSDVTPASDRLSFTDRGDAEGCKVWMQRVGPWLMVIDDHQCGGFLVTFSGVWRR